MRNFNYLNYTGRQWDNEILSLVSAIHEFRGRQEMYLIQKPAVLERLVRISRIQSTESSNAIEGIFTSSGRLKALVQEKTTPKNRSEEEIAGYRYVLSEIHESFEYIPLRSNYILQLHRDLYRFTGTSIGGRFKDSQNHIVSVDEDGNQTVLFTPLDAFDTPQAIDLICEQYNRAVSDGKLDPLIMIPVFIHDFLCIHPFSDGNGRMSRLLTTLLLYRSGYVVGRYISLEKKIADDKALYYDSLEESQVGWHEEADDPTPFIKYLLRILVKAYRDFEDRVDIVEMKVPAVEQVRRAVLLKVGIFTKSEIMELCPSLGRASVENSLTALVQEGFIIRQGKGRATVYFRADSLL